MNEQHFCKTCWISGNTLSIVKSSNSRDYEKKSCIHDGHSEK